MTRAKILIVDGHSFIFHCPALSRRYLRNGPEVREEVIAHLTALQDATDWHVVVVFDGTGRKPTDASEENGIHVFYSAAGHTADALIERLAAKYASKHDVTVVTNDNLERTTAHTFGATTMRAEHLVAEMETAARDLQTRIARLSRC